MPSFLFRIRDILKGSGLSMRSAAMARRVFASDSADADVDNGNQFWLQDAPAMVMPKSLLDFMENPTEKWMRTGGAICGYPLGIEHSY